MLRGWHDLFPGMDSNTAQHTTAWLLDRARGGDRNARSALVARVEPLLRRFAHGRIPQLLRHREDTADLVQLTWTKVLDKLDAIDASEPGAFFAYLRAVLINALRESLRREAIAPVAAGGELADKAAAVVPAAHVDPTDWIAYEQSLAALAPEHRGIVLMRYEFGMSFAEIGAELGESPDGVRMKLNRAIARMAQAAGSASAT
jgi:RNA polymerase sigma-70 factor (ECF subfamily)